MCLYRGLYLYTPTVDHLLYAAILSVRVVKTLHNNPYSLITIKTANYYPSIPLGPPTKMGGAYCTRARDTVFIGHLGRLCMAAASASQKDEKPCRVCGDFKTWKRQQSQQKSKKSDGAKDCPADREELGRATWTFLHTMAAYYPEHPNVTEQEDMKTFMKTFSKFYPCRDCAEHLRERMKVNPVKVTNQNELSQWLCQIHNDINVLLGKKSFDCSKVNERWKDGWKDGSCDL